MSDREIPDETWDAAIQELIDSGLCERITINGEPGLRLTELGMLSAENMRKSETLQ